MRNSDWSSDVCSSDRRPLSSRRRATAATTCWRRSDWSRASRYTVVLRQSESAACGGRTEANHRIHASFIEQTPCCVAPAGTTGSRGIGVANGHGVLGRAAALRSEEHTSELQSLMRISYAVFCLKKKTNKQHT